jgi:hypothetical protein
MIASLLLAFVVTHGPSVERLDELRTKLRPLLTALAIVESGDKDNVPDGDGGKAIGRYQIWSVYWQDATEYAPAIGGEYKAVKSKDYAERVIVAYFLRYGKEAVAAHDFEKLARIHNGGPKGYKKRATDKYWNRVKTHLTPCSFCGRYE